MYDNYELNIRNRAKWYECYVSINEVVHRIYYKTTIDGMFHLYLDDKCVMSKKNWIVKLQGLEYLLNINNEILHCVFDEKKLDVAMYGKYIKSQKNYIPNKVVCRYRITSIIASIVGIACSFACALDKVNRQVMLVIAVVCLAIMYASSKYYDFYKKKAKKEQMKMSITEGC